MKTQDVLNLAAFIEGMNEELDVCSEELKALWRFAGKQLPALLVAVVNTKGLPSKAVKLIGRK